MQLPSGRGPVLDSSESCRLRVRTSPQLTGRLWSAANQRAVSSQRVTHAPAAQHTQSGARRSDCSSLPASKHQRSRCSRPCVATRAHRGQADPRIQCPLHRRSSARRRDTSPMMGHGGHDGGRPSFAASPASALARPPDCSLLSPADQAGCHASKTTAPRPKQKAESSTLCPSPPSAA